MKRPSYSNPRYAGAVREQESLLARLVLEPLGSDLRWVGGADVSFAFHGTTFWGGVVVCDAQKGFEVVDSAVVRMDVDFPYIPGLLGFREVPVLAEAFRALEKRPRVTLVDGHGTAHPRGLGSASHLGVTLGVPTVGCAKSPLCGSYREPGPNKGSFSLVTFEKRVVGSVLRTRRGVKPVFVSPGHLSDLSTSRELALACSPRYRIPEPIRRAHALVNEARRGETEPTLDLGGPPS